MVKNSPITTGIPFTKSGEKTAKNLILSMLSNGQKQTNTAIYGEISKTTPITYQGVRKALLSLTAGGTVLKDRNRYYLSAAWAKATRMAMEEIEENTKAGGIIPFEEMPDQWVQTVEFDTISEAYYYALKQLIRARDSMPGKKLVACIQPHALPLTMVKKEEYQATIQLKGKHYIACAGNTALDKANLEVWQKVGATTAMDCNVPATADLAVTGDFIIEINLSPAMRKKVDQLFKNAKGLDPEALIQMQRTWFNMKVVSVVRISRNGRKARELEKLIIGEVINKLRLSPG